MPQQADSFLVLKIHRHLAKIDFRHAIFAGQIEPIRFDLAAADKPLFAKDIEPEAFSTIVKRFCCEDSKHGVSPCLC